MAASHTFCGVTAQIMERIRQLARSEHGIVFDPPDGDQGTATGRTPLGECVVHFKHDLAGAALVLTLLKKPTLLPAGLLWSSIKQEIDRFGAMK
jgi:hypothetical protein